MSSNDSSEDDERQRTLPFEDVMTSRLVSLARFARGKAQRRVLVDALIEQLSSSDDRHGDRDLVRDILGESKWKGTKEGVGGKN